MSGYEFTVNRRMGGHDGPTEWEFSTRVLGDRVMRLAALQHPHLCAFLVRDVSTFCIREGAPENVLHDVVAFLGAWPDEVDERLAKLAATVPE